MTSSARKDVGQKRMDRRHAPGALAAGLAFVLAAAGCGSSPVPFLVPNERPQVELTARPQMEDSIYYSVRLQWIGYDPDGRVEYFLWAVVDPPAVSDTAWTRIGRSEISLFFRSTTPRDPLPPPGAAIPSSDYHTFVVKAVDNQAMPSAVASISFTSYTVAPYTTFESPKPSGSLVPTAPTILIRWSGVDPDGERNQKPIFYKTLLVSEVTIQTQLGITSKPNKNDIQKFFGDYAPDFASWETRPPDSTYRQIEGLSPSQEWYFAVCAFDEAGAYEPRFATDRNVLRFRPTTTLAPPRITVGNSFFEYTQAAGGIEIEEHRVRRIEVGADPKNLVDFHWSAVPGAEGTEINGYRWVLDPLGGDIFDETPRETDQQTYRWSTWSQTETEAFLGPFTADFGEEVRHRFYVQTRDNVGLISMVIVEMLVVPPNFRDPARAKPLLFVDDFDQSLDRLDRQPYGLFPTEAVLDTLLFAVGGVPYQYRPPGTLSQPGIFAGFEADTLDYRQIPYVGVPLKILSDYVGVVWYVHAGDAAKKNEKFKDIVGVEPALRYHNSPGSLNTLAVYLNQGGKMWLFGDGIVPAIADGYVERYSGSPAPKPYTHAGDRPSAGSILWPGNFLYDYMKVRTEMLNNGYIGYYADPENLKDAVPYLPQFRTPGAPWPYTGWTGGRGAMDDPRVGPSSQRNVPTWDGLPFLTLRTDPTDLPVGATNPPDLRDAIFYISAPTFIQEDSIPGPRQGLYSTLDTLYIMRARIYDLATQNINADGKPVMFYYHGADHGEIGWTTLPLWWFDRVKASQLADVMLGRWGYVRNPNRQAWTGPGSVHDRYGRAKEEQIAP